MKLFSLLAPAVWVLLAVKPAAANLFVMPPAHQIGPRQIVRHHWGWIVKYGPHGSVVERTTDGGRSWKDRTPPEFTRMAPDLNDTDTFPSSFGLSFLGSKRCWIAFGSRVKDEIVVEKTADGGQHWRYTTIAGGSQSVILQFLDTEHGFLLALGGPAAGLMEKDFYSTGDGGKTWARGGSPDMVRDSYYPSGMAFRNTQEGWITGSNHGDAAVPLVRTRDGGRTWKFQTIPLPASYPDAYGDASQPRFRGRSRRRGAFTVGLRNNSPEWAETVNYVTDDGGERWHIAGPIGRKSR